MLKNTVKIEGMSCNMCEAHISETIRKSVPEAKKVSASHKKNEATFITENPVNAEELKTAIDATGYKFISFSEENYEKKGLFGLKK